MSAELAEIAAVEGRHAEIQKKMAALEVELAAVKASNAEALAKVEALQAIALADRKALDAAEATYALLRNAVFESADLVAQITGFFVTTHWFARRAPPAPAVRKHALRDRPYDHAFLEPEGELAHVLAFAACSRLTKDVALGDAVWGPHLEIMEYQFPGSIDEFGLGLGRLGAEYTEPRDLGSYESLSKFRRYKAVRAYYERVHGELRACADPSTWSEDDWAGMRKTAKSAFDNVYRNVELLESPDYALDACTPEWCASTALECFVLPEFMQYGICAGSVRNTLGPGGDIWDYRDGQRTTRPARGLEYAIVGFGCAEGEEYLNALIGEELFAGYNR